MRFAVDFGRNLMGPWKLGQHRVYRFLNSEIRKRVSTYPNYFRIIWWKIDLTLEWGTELRKTK